MALFRGSRYLRTPVYARMGQRFILGIREKTKFTESIASYYQVVAGDTVDGIAQKFYGNARFFWAILDANRDKLRSELDIKSGMILMIPAFQEVSRLSE